MNKTIDYNDFYENVCKFNNIAGNKASWDGFIAQAKCLKEEVNELEEAVKDKDVVEVLDAAVDIIYVAMGLMQQLEKLGVDTQGAMQQVGDDNLKKFPSDEASAIATIKYYVGKNIHTHFALNTEYGVYCIKDTNGKVRKPYDFAPTNLSQYAVNIQVK